MSGDKEAFFWRENPEWYRVTEEGEYELTEKAPERAKRSFEIAMTPRSSKKNPFL